MATVEDHRHAPDWYPDPTRRHRLRYFDGASWTEHAADDAGALHDPLGDLPPGLLQWPDPQAMLDSGRPVAAVDTPRVTMWVLAVLSLAFVRITVNAQSIVVPVGVIFAALCWRVTNTPLVEQWRAGHDDDVTQIWTARRVAAVLAFVSVVIAILAAP
jgi:uncharacterized protein DUF2510